MEAVIMKKIEHTFGKERGKLLNYIKLKVSSIEDAEDILQDVFTSALVHMSVTEPINNCAAWLFTAAKNKIIDWYRKKKLRKVSLEGDEEGISLEGLLASSGLSCEQEFIRGIVAEALDQALEELPDNQREVFVLQAVEGKTFRQISEETGIPVNTLIARKRYAVLFLKKRLKEIKELLDEYR
jgi:RNA polymerase sigma factor (sigma-70 family)